MPSSSPQWRSERDQSNLGVAPGVEGYFYALRKPIIHINTRGL